MVIQNLYQRFVFCRWMQEFYAERYYFNNVANTLNLLRVMREHGSGTKMQGIESVWNGADKERRACDEDI